jgi:CcmD family protein
MYEFLSQNQLYIVLSVTLITWFGVIFYLMRLDKRIAQSEKQLKKD